MSAPDGPAGDATPAAGAPAAPSAQLDAPTRILQATARLLVERGVARFNLQEVAEAAAVSKGLIHYHYHDRDTLLTRLVESLAADVARRQQAALADATAETAVDDLWQWLDGELRRGQLRVLQELTQEPGALVRSAVNAAAAHRRAAAAAVVERLLALHDRRLRLPHHLLADVVVAFEDGLVLAAAVQPEQDPRLAFDVFWLAVLRLVE